MASKRKEPRNMMDFILNHINDEDLATAALITPVPASVQPSPQFLNDLRAQLLEISAREGTQSRAA